MTEWDPADRARYERAMAAGAAQYQDVIDTLNLAGMPTEFTQTGGMCAALEVSLGEGVGYLLITDAVDTLSWDREYHQGWTVGAYDDDESQEAAWINSTEDSSVQALLSLVEQAVRR